MKRLKITLPRTRKLSSHRLQALAGVILIVFSLLASLPINDWLTAKKYHLNDASLQVIGKAKPELASKLVLNVKSGVYEFNAANKKPAEGSSSTSSDPNEVARQLQKQQSVVGSSKDANLYSLDLPTNPKQGISIYDNNANLSIKLIPKFDQSAGRKVQDRLVYPMAGGVKAVYTVKNNGVKEDLVFDRSPKSGIASFSYDLQLPVSLEARLLEDNSLGVYSADPALFGNISFGADEDRAKVESARQNAKKDHLVFAIPRPIITAKDGKIGNAYAGFKLEGKTLTVSAFELGTIRGAFSIDPSVVVTSSSDFTSGNDEGNIEFGVDEIRRGILTGGTVNTWTSTTAFTNSRRSSASAAYNGYLYVSGGFGGAYYNDVQYAAINTLDGTVGAWTPGPAFTSPRSSHQMVAYNGYLYILGGANDGPPYYNDTQYASLDPTTGAVGAWTSSVNTFTGVRDEFTAVAANGYLYILGGWNGSANYNDVQYASIKANGSLSSWASTTVLPVAGLNMVASVYNNYLYIVGGGSNATADTTVRYAFIKSDGSLGSWVTGTSLPVGRYGHGSRIYKGYLYVYGGSDGSAVRSDTMYAPVYAGGNIGSWTTTNLFTTARKFVSAAMYNGYLYVLGGDTGAVLQNDVQKTKIDGNGVLSPFLTAANSPATARAFAPSVAMNGYLYLIGGCTAISGDTCSTTSTLVSFAKINSDGTLSTWANTTNALPAARGMGAAVGHEGRLYYIAGRPAATTLSSAVYYVSVSSSTGNTGAAWTSVANPSGLSNSWGHSAVIFNNSLYILGGCTSTAAGCTTFSNAVVQAQLALAGGFASNPNCANTFCPMTSFTTARWGQAASINGNTIYLTGGLHATSDTACSVAAGFVCSDVQYATIGTNGVLSAWSATSNIPTAVYASALVATKGYLYASSGKTDLASFSAASAYAKLTATGTIATDSGCGTAWCAAPNAPLAKGAYGYASASETIYLVGGQTASTTVVATAYFSQVNNGGSTATGSWTSSPNRMPTTNNGGGSFAYNNYLYYIAGNPTGTTTAYAPLNGDGSVGVWQATAPLVTATSSSDAVVFNGYVYVMAGYNGSNNIATAQFSKINSNGSLGTWQVTTSYPLALGNMSKIAYNGYIYGLGGSNSSAVTNNSVYYAPLNPTTGAIGAWTPTSSFTTTREIAATTAVNGYAYISGGTNGAAIGDTQYAKINADGSLGAWQYATTYPEPRYGQGIAAYGGYMYILQGRSVSLFVDSVYAAPILANGQLGKWELQAFKPNANNYDLKSAAANGYIYIVGGNPATDVIQYAPLSASSRMASYSKTIDFGAFKAISQVSYTGSVPTGRNAFSFKSAGESGIFNPSSKSLSTFTGSCVVSNSRYVSLTVKLDDSADTSFPDSTVTSIQDITFTFQQATGVPTDKRLRGGKFFNTEILSSLDLFKSDESSGGISPCL